MSSLRTNIFFKKKIAVLGLGIEGMSSAKYLKAHGAIVTELDLKNGKDYLKNLDKFDMIVRSPGIKRNLPELVAAEKKGVVITSQTQLFFDLCPAEIIGVTGTKGKGTTSALIYEMLKKQGFESYLGGNIGQPPIEFLDKLNPQSKVVLELSSYQLQDLKKSPRIAVVLMITQEHLAPDKKDAPHQNYHESLSEYIDAKQNIIRYQNQNDFAVINRDYPASSESDIYTNGKAYQVSRERECEEGCFVKDGKIVIRRKVAKRSNLDQGSTLTDLTEIIDTKDILLPGKHNLENVCAAVMAANFAGVSKKAMVSVLTSFKGLEHRLELVGEINGVKYYDDSFSTTPETAIAAIEAFKEPEVLILGGAHKGSDFTKLGRVINKAKNIKAIIGVGVEWERIKSAIQIAVQRHSGKSRQGRDASRISNKAERSWTSQDDNFILVEGTKDMKIIVAAAAKIAKPGDVVLLSPACSSFDIFPNYKVRGELFKIEVRKLS